MGLAKPRDSRPREGCEKKTKGEARRGGRRKREGRNGRIKGSSAGSRWLVRPLANGSPNTSTPAASHPLGSCKPVGGRGGLSVTVARTPFHDEIVRLQSR